MDFLSNLELGFSVALSAHNLLYCLIGVFLGTAVGVLPGLGPAATLSLLLPITFGMPPTSAVIMLAGIYYGTAYGGSITSILLNIPGEASSVVTCIDGHEMARRGRAGPALGIAAFGSFIAGTIAVVAISVVGPAVAGMALRFGPPEYAALVVLGLVLICFMSEADMVRGLTMVALGLLLSTIGLDPILGSERFTFGSTSLADGINLAVLAMGLFGVAELLMIATRPPEQAEFLRQPTRLRALLPSRADWRRSAGPIGRGTVIGFILGLIPGGGGIIASFASYVLEKRLSRRPEEFGKGAIEGVAGPESANNAGVQATFLPLLTLGLPANVVLAIMMGALLVHGITPGPRLVTDHPELFWGVVASMYVGNVLLLVLNVPLIAVFVSMLRLPYAILAPLILMFCIVGAYSLNNNVADVYMLGVFGLLGLGLRLARFDPAPLVLAFALGQLLEQSLRQSLLMRQGSPVVFLERPIAASFLALAATLLLAAAYKELRRRAAASVAGAAAL
ncbi:tripartite tricarboxylate transporter permease [Vineibacter terrae]|uniref:Tripartite tricarboxylate transporter permease n=1 Tax=Vineibacter terrae TaxID=2586908 RepID=A0A5C8PI19_9HYPH|nr:tripartite tricarboxylate transporter permease [Vineibacter terrae]TXL73458.1 tripartite tricarboxylate transporter permease [Vineibacter terrae]